MTRNPTLSARLEIERHFSTAGAFKIMLFFTRKSLSDDLQLYSHARKKQLNIRCECIDPNEKKIAQFILHSIFLMIIN